MTNPHNLNLSIRLALEFVEYNPRVKKCLWKGEELGLISIVEDKSLRIFDVILLCSYGAWCCYVESDDTLDGHQQELLKEEWNYER